MKINGFDILKYYLLVSITNELLFTQKNNNSKNNND